MSNTSTHESELATYEELRDLMDELNHKLSTINKSLTGVKMSYKGGHNVTEIRTALALADKVLELAEGSNGEVA